MLVAPTKLFLLVSAALMVFVAPTPTAASCVAGCSAGYFYSNCSSTCIKCPAGYTCTGALTQPAPCAAGTYNALVGQTTGACLACASGLGSTAGAEVCMPCNLLFYSNSGVCTACAVGQVPNAGGTACVACSNGFYASTATGVCEKCSAGYACPTKNVDKEILCTSGQYVNSVTGLCTTCEAGFACPSTTGDCGLLNAPTSRFACPMGTYATAGQTKCTTCPPMRFCPDPTTATVSVCPTGYYSLGGASVCTACPEGFRCPTASADGVPLRCTNGESSPLASTTCTPCPAGSQCPNVDTQLPCPAGSYSTSGSTFCSLCPAGSSCSNSSLSPVLCTAGTYSAAGATSCTSCPQNTGTAFYATGSGNTVCSICPAYSACPVSNVAPTPCTRGTISLPGAYVCSSCSDLYGSLATYAVAAGTPCLVCPAGSRCPTANVDPVACPSGSYALAGKFTCSACPAGHYCPVTNALPIPCPYGSYSIGSNTTCALCPLDSGCPNRGADPVPCDVANGFYSPLGDPVCRFCPPGQTCTSNPSSNATAFVCPLGTYRTSPASLECQPCSPGFYCPYGDMDPIICPAGTFSMFNATNCTTCPAGFACPNRTVPIGCSMGWFSRAGAAVCTPCPEGFRCPQPSVEPILCLLGTFATGAATNCTSCPAGYECPSTSNFNTAAGACRPGTFSVGGQSRCTVCTAGFFCPNTNNSVSTACTTGYYSYMGATSCTPCPAGYICPNTNGAIQPPTRCLAGTYSTGLALTCTPCPAGSACPYTDAATVNVCPTGTFSGPNAVSCTTCSPGYYCPTTVVTNTMPSFGSVGFGRQIPCDPGYYAGAGQTSCFPCPTGYYCTSTTSTDGGRLRCPSGYFPGISGVYAALAAVECVRCPAGSTCTNPAAPPVACTSGTYSLEGICYACPAGFKCPTVNAAPVPCSAGTYSTNSSTTCFPCAAGFLCTAQSTTPTPVDRPCPLGSYCPEGSVVPILCPAGTMGLFRNGVNQSHACSDCLPGYTCPTGTEGVSAMNSCPEGFYCPPGSPFPTPCPAGTYSNDQRATSRASCVLCPDGYFCPAGTARYAANPCPPGFFCPAGTGNGFDHGCPVGTYSPEYKATNGRQCYTCPSGHYCPIVGLTAAIPCAAGGYQPEPGSARCLPCEPGWACTTIGMITSRSTTCSAGHYCPAGTANPSKVPCPGGSFTRKTNLADASECFACWRGYACPPGTGKSPTINPIDCQPGFYCPGTPPPDNGQDVTLAMYAGLTTSRPNQYPCPPGTYTAQYNLYSAAQCSTCPAGQFCTGGLASPNGACAAGHYCPLGSFKSTQKPCKGGTYNPNVGLVSQDDCLPCQPGNYCPEGSISMTPCAAGTYTPFNLTNSSGPSGLIDSGMCLQCPAGYRCAIQSVQPTACTVGQYSSMLSSTCASCTVGHYCPNPGTSDDQMNRIFECPAGLFCPAALNKIPSMSAEACPKGFYCPRGTVAPVACPIGTFNPNTGRPALTDCQPCTRGYFCSAIGISAVSGECDPGYYCPAGSKSAQEVPCPARYYRSNTRGESEEFCAVCPRGYFCLEGTADPTPCTRGYYCVAGSEVPQPCPIGTFGNTTHLRSQDECSACTAGYYCDGLGLPNPTGLCDPGYFCISRAYTSAPPGLPTGGLCPKGGYCPPGSSFPTACDEGTFNNFTGGSTQLDCTTCTPGYYCSGSNLPFPTGPCSAGYYCTGGASLPTQFRTPAGHYSPVGSPAPIECPLGTFNPSPAQGACQSCVAGYYCPTRAMTTYLPCTIGSFCPAGSVLPKACPRGTYQPETRMINMTNCIMCSPGKYCLVTNLSTPTGLCDQGFYCKRGCVTSDCSFYSLNYGVIANTIPNPGLLNDIGGICPWGHYCVNGTAHPQACPAGTVRDNVGAKNSSECQPCPATYYCPSTGTSSLLPSNAPVLCRAGYYCPGPVATSGPLSLIGCSDSACSNHQGESCSNIYVDCTVSGYNYILSLPGPRKCARGFMCPAGSQQPTMCTSINYGKSTYQDQMAQAQCNICPRGKWCDSTVPLSIMLPQDCPAGRYCPFGTDKIQPKCPPGSWSDGSLLQNMTQCKLCPPGRYCPYPGTTTQSTASMPFCFGGYWCGSGALDGYGNVGILRGLGGPCLPGYFCPNGTKSNASYACRPGTYKPTYFGSDDTSCIQCPGGMYCQGSGKPAITGPCSNGYYCPLACEDQYCARQSCTFSITPFAINWQGGPCPPGYFCNGTATVGPILPAVCPDGRYQDEIGKDACKMCPAGFYCNNISKVPLKCGVGNYCPAGTGPATIQACPPGTYSFFSRASSLADCRLCPAGRYCPFPSMNSTTLLCNAGVFCTSGAAVAIGTVGSQGGVTGTCPKGHYCLTGTTTNTSYPCPPGTFNPLTGSTNASACQACTPGFYCAGWGNFKVTGICASGHYCPTSCQDAQCSNQPCSGNCAHPTPYMTPAYASGGVCPSGHYCAPSNVSGVWTGATAPVMCVNGTYAPDSGSSNCTVCPAGAWCGARETQPQTCPAGHYCPAGTISPTQFPCPTGTYASTVNNTALAGCQRCVGGKYCPSTGMTAAGPLCSPGYYCTSGAYIADGTPGVVAGGSGGICPPGFYCPAGTVTSSEFPCPQGTYQPFTLRNNATACLSCSPGFYCPQQNQTSAVLWCAAGYYCPAGCANSQCTNMQQNNTLNGGYCPTGHICPQEATRGASSPTPCAAGTFASATASVTCSPCPSGYYCTPGSTTPFACPAGRYCPNGTTSVQPMCPPGSYSDMQGGRAVSDCVLCAPGRYCAGNGNVSFTGNCSAGYYCLSGAALPNSTTGVLGGVTGVCPAGYYCPSGTRDPFEFPCPVGTYNPVTGAVSVAECVPCLPGFYCAAAGQKNVTHRCAGGYYCPSGCTTAQCSTAFPVGGNCSLRYGGPCPRGFYCPTNITTNATMSVIGGVTTLRGSIVPLACDPGFYSPSVGAETCSQCPAGYYCLTGREDSPMPIVCPPGAYCPAGTGSVPPPCPPGSYSNATGLNASSQCILCSAARHCPSFGMTVPGGLCTRGYYCIDGAIDVYGRLGTLGGTTSPFARDAQGRAVCPAGYYCPLGSAAPLTCPPGSYNPFTGGYNSTQSCLPCPGGRYCESPGLAAPTGFCSAGFVCPGGCAVATCYSCPRGCRTAKGGDCPIAHYCPVGTSAPIPCPEGSTANHTGAAVCDGCPAMYYCPIGSTPVLCPAGRYCPANTTSTIPGCPTGSFSNVTGRSTSTQCSRCTAAKACTTTGLVAADAWCDEGYFCQEGASSATGTVGTLGGTAGICPTGHYCPAAVSAPVQCPIGTFNPNTGARNITSCQLCTPGQYCASTGLSAPTGPCTAGYFCTSGQSTATPATGICPTGRYCPAGSPAPELCPAGTYSPLTLRVAVSACVACPQGLYCVAGESAPGTANCSAGWYCSGGANQSMPVVNGGPCTAGYYCPSGSVKMVNCLSGRYCATGMLAFPTGLCSAGYYCRENATTPTPTDGATGNSCPIGAYCPIGSINPTLCPSGTFNPNTIQPAIGSCLACTPGYYCPNNGQSTVTLQCATGYYCPAGQTIASPASYICPRGHFCIAGSSAPVRCLAGSYQDVPGQSVCKSCPSGYYCRPTNLCPGFNFTMPTPCPAGHYCPANTAFATQYPCPAGTYSSAVGMSTNATCKACDAGRFCGTSGMSAPGANCSAGYYCTNGSSSATPTAPYGGVCPLGHFCPAGSMAPSACPIGSFGPTTGLRYESECTSCSPGSFCNATGASSVSGPCGAGYYCVGGEVSAKPIGRVCPYGMICPAGSATYNKCPSGFHAPGAGLWQCTKCPAGTYCDSIIPCGHCPITPCVGNFTCTRSCPAGSYCPAGTQSAKQYLCPPGRYGSQLGLMNASACVTCPPGQYCPDPGMSAISSLYCYAGYYCIKGAFVANPTDNITGGICTPGHYCPKGTLGPVACPIGTFQPAYGATNRTACQSCTPGYACTIPGLSAPNAECQGGYYCPGGTSSPTAPQYLCTVGHYCQNRSTAPVPCPSGQWALTRGLAQCDMCEAGFYCNQNETCPGTNLSKPVSCLVGHYCPPGTLNGDQFPCPIGTYNDRIGLKNISECTACPPGKVCPQPGMSTNLVNCSAGYYCIRSANVTNPTDGVTGDQCPPGNYCESGVAAPVGCPQGTYSNVSGLSSASQCTNCTAGMYCSSIGLTSPTGSCDAGYYCPAGMVVPNPSAFECLGGKYCPIGTAVPFDCPNGTYVPENVRRRSSCFLCPSGYFCNLLEQQASPYNKPNTMVLPQFCPRGNYCPQGTRYQNEYPCLPGTYSNQSGLAAASDCWSCIPGHYCLLPGRTFVTGPCSAGYYCTGGSNTSQPSLPAVPAFKGGVCPSGFYCPVGTGAEGKPCPPGSFFGGTGATNITWCRPCRPGYFCPTSRTTVDTGAGQCAAGHYCPGGDSVSSNPKFICPKGHFCPTGSPQPIPCPGGSYAANAGSSVCTFCPEYYFCPRGAVMPTLCYKSHVCPAGSAYPYICPNGTYASSALAAMKSTSECATCPAGVYCTNGTITGPCAAGYLCEFGNNVPDPSTSTDIGNRKKGGLCPIGHYCPQGTTYKRPCTNQTVGYTTGLQAATDCSPCRPGYYCVETSVVPIDCPQGYYCPGYVGRSIGLIACPTGTYNPKKFATDLSWCSPCRQGFYCPVTAMTAPYTFPTPPGYYSSPGQAKPYPCPGGTYQPFNGHLASNSSACITCPAGYYCGPQSTTWNQTCPEGTFCPPGTTYPFHCPGGHYCPHRAVEPVTCPAGFYCPSLSTYPRLCWNGTYCPTRTEIPLLCPNGYVSKNTTVSRTSVTEACDACPAGTWSTNSIFCEPCTPGYVCTGATSTSTPLNVTRDGGYICPIGHYCPAGSYVPTPCPAGRFNNQVGGRTVDACTPCPKGFYQPTIGASYCVRCGVTAASIEGSTTCSCVGAYRQFQPGDGSCRCQPGYVFYSDLHRISEEDSLLPCTPKIFERCPPGLIRNTMGNCVDPSDQASCAYCPGKKGRLDPVVGICLCDTIEVPDTVCNETCVRESQKLLIDTSSNSIVHYDPTTGSRLVIDLDSSGILGERRCAAGRSNCEVQMLRLSAEGSRAVFNPPTTAITASTTAPQSTNRRLMASTTATSVDKTLANPIVCLNYGDAVIWDISDPSRQHFPVYQKDNLLNTNPSFDYTLFRELGEKIRAPNLTIKSFMFTFDVPGVYVFQDNANTNSLQVFRVVSASEQCSAVRFNPITGTSLVALGVKRQNDLTLAPDWILIGVLMGGLFLLVAGLIGGLWHFRRQTWGIVGTALPRYRNLGMSSLGTEKGVHRSGGGGGTEKFVIPPNSSGLITLRLETPTRDFVPSEFIKVVADEAGVDERHINIMSISENTATVRFVLSDLEDPQAAANLLVNRIADTTNDIHTKLAILACEEVGEMAEDQHPSYSMADIEDELWDYERAVDLEGFNVRTLYDKLEDQTIHIVSQLTNQRDDLLILCDKILVESEALKDMFVRIRVEIDENNKKEKEMLETRDAKISSGTIEFDLPDDLKIAVTRWLDNFFADNMAMLMSNVRVSTETVVIEQPVEIIEHETVVHEMGPDGKITTHTYSGPAPTEEEVAEIAGVQGFDENIFKGKSIHAARRTRAADQPLDAEMERELRQRLNVIEKNMNTEIQDDSDLDDGERATRAVKREQVLQRRLRRLRRAMDYMILPTALEELPPIEGVATPDEALANRKKRQEWVAARKKERDALDAIPEALRDRADVSPEERHQRQVLREAYLARRAHRIADLLKTLEVPTSMQDDDNLPAAEREERRMKREKFLALKIDKARRLRADTMVPMELDDDSDLDDSERTRRNEEREFVVNDVMKNNPAGPALPDPQDPNVSARQRNNRAKAQTMVMGRRVAQVKMELALADEDEGVSDHSDLDKDERTKRQQKRQQLAAKKGIRIMEAAEALPAGGRSKTALVNAVATEEFELATTDRMPAEYEDDSDLDEDDRSTRKRLRKAFKAGKTSKPEDKATPENEDDDSASPKELKSRRDVNVAFRRGRDARAANVAAFAASRAAKNIVAEAEELSKNDTTKNYFEHGKQQDKSLQMPAEYNGNDARARRLQAAFMAGKRTQTMMTVPEELRDSEALPAAERQRREVLNVAFKKGADAKVAVGVPAELEDSPHLGNEEREERTLLREAFVRGSRVAQARIARAETEMAYDDDDDMQRDIKSAVEAGARAGVSGATALPTELRDDLPFLSAEEVARRRVLQGYFMQSLKAQQANADVGEMLEDASLPEAQRKAIKEAFEKGKKSQAAGSAMPKELEETPGMTADAKIALKARRAAYFKGMQAARVSEMLETELVQDPALSSKDRRELTAAMARGRQAQEDVDNVPKEIQDVMMLPDEDRNQRAVCRRAVEVGRMARVANAIPQDLPEADGMSAEEKAAAAKTLTPIAQVSKTAKKVAAESAPADDEAEAADTSLSADKQKALLKLRRDHQMAYKQLKDRQKSEVTAVMEEQEEEIISIAKKAENLLAEEFMRERKVLSERHTDELRMAPADKQSDIKKRQVTEMRELQASQEEARAQAQKDVADAAAEKRKKLQVIMEQKANNEIRLAKTIHNDQDNEIKRLKDDSLLSQKMSDIARESDLKKQKDALMERLKLRERRQKAKMNKEKEFLESHLKQTEKLELEALESQIAKTKARMIERARNMHKSSPAEAEEEVARIERLMASELELQKGSLVARMTAERMEREKELADRHAEEKAHELKVAQDEVDQLIEAKRRIEGSAPSAEEERLTDNAKRAVEMMVEQKRLRDEMAAQRSKDAEAKSETSNDTKVKEDALREIHRREKERGEKLTDAQKRAILEEFRSAAAKMDSAMSDEQKRQQDETKRRLEERRRKKEAEANRKHVEEMTAELRRQEEEQRKKAADMAKKMAIKPISAELPKEVISAEEEIEQKMQRNKENMRKKHEEEARKLESHLDDEIKKYQEKELQKLKNEAQRRKLELLSQHNAKESMSMSEEARTSMIKNHENEAKKLQEQLDSEAAIQRAKLMDQLEARRRKKRGELQDKQRTENIKEASKQEQERDDFVRQAKLNHEKKAIDEAVKKAQGASKAVKAEDVAEVIMSERHREEVTALLARQAKRRGEEMNIRDGKLKAEKDDLQARLDNRVKAEIDNIPADHPDREKRIEAIRAKARQMIAERLPELEGKHKDESQTFMDQLELEFAEEQLQLKMRQWNDVAQACGMSAPEQTIAKYQAKVAERQGAEAEDELVRFRKEREAENQRLQEKLAQEKAEYEAKMKTEMERLKQEQEEELKRREAAMMDELKLERERKEKRLLAARQATMGAGDATPTTRENDDDMKKRLYDDYKSEVSRVNQLMNRERERQQNDLESKLRLKMERRKAAQEKKGDASIGSPSVLVASMPLASSGGGATVTSMVRDATSAVTVAKPAISHTTTTVDTTSHVSAPQFTVVAGASPAASSSVAVTGEYQAWVGGLVAQLSNSPIMEKLIKIERMLQGQVKHGLLSYYLDTKDRQIKTNEGKLDAMDVSELTSAQFVVYCFAASVRENIARIGVELPQVKIQIARTLPDAQTNASAFRNSYFYDASRRTLFVRDTRLSSIGEFMLVMLHALAHIKAAMRADRGVSSWNDADPAFLSEFYGLLEVCTEEMFYMRLPATLAHRESKEGREYRPERIMSADSLSAMEDQLKTIGKANREAFLKTYFMM